MMSEHKTQRAYSVLILFNFCFYDNLQYDKLYYSKQEYCFQMCVWRAIPTNMEYRIWIFAEVLTLYIFKNKRSILHNYFFLIYHSTPWRLLSTFTIFIMTGIWTQDVLAQYISLQCYNSQWFISVGMKVLTPAWKYKQEILTAQTPKRLTKKFPLNLFASIWNISGKKKLF